VLLLFVSGMHSRNKRETMRILERVGYRFWQLKQELMVRPLPPEAWREIQAILTMAEIQLFHCFSPSDQVHSYRVMRTLQAAGYHSPALLAAALLHDIGKTKVGLSLVDRVVIVLTQVFWPAQIAAWGQGGLRGWRRPFVVRAQHPNWGAEMAQAAGSLSLTVALIRRHQDNLPDPAATEEDELLRCLQWADDQN
jgi:hypothetical protein